MLECSVNESIQIYRVYRVTESTFRWLTEIWNTKKCSNRKIHIKSAPYASSTSIQSYMVQSVQVRHKLFKQSTWPRWAQNKFWEIYFRWFSKQAFGANASITISDLLSRGPFHMRNSSAQQHYYIRTMHTHSLRAIRDMYITTGFGNARFSRTLMCMQLVVRNRAKRLSGLWQTKEFCHSTKVKLIGLTGCRNPARRNESSLNSEYLNISRNHIHEDFFIDRNVIYARGVAQGLEQDPSFYIAIQKHSRIVMIT